MLFRSAKQTSEEIRKYLKNHPEFKDHQISNVHWTSNRDTAKKEGDHEKTTGIKDVNSNADLILTLKHPKTGQTKYVGISAKYGTEPQPNYRNDGLAALEQKSGLKKETLTDIQKAHDQDMADRLGYTGTKAERHAQYKIGRKLKGEERAAWKEKTGSNKGFMPKKKESLRARAAEDASVLARKKMARHLDAGLGNMSDDEAYDFFNLEDKNQAEIETLRDIKSLFLNHQKQLNNQMQQKNGTHSSWAKICENVLRFKSMILNEDYGFFSILKKSLIIIFLFLPYFKNGLYNEESVKLWTDNFNPIKITKDSSGKVVKGKMIQIYWAWKDFRSEETRLNSSHIPLSRMPSSA